MDRLDVQRLDRQKNFSLPMRLTVGQVGLVVHMLARIAFSNLPAADSRQRARCVSTGRFVAWSRAAALRSPAAPVVVPLLPAQAVTVAPPVVVVDAIDAPPVVVVDADKAVTAPLVRALLLLVALVTAAGRRVATLILAALPTIRRAAALVALAATLSGAGCPAAAAAEAPPWGSGSAVGAVGAAALGDGATTRSPRGAWTPNAGRRACQGSKTPKPPPRTPHARCGGPQRRKMQKKGSPLGSLMMIVIVNESYAGCSVMLLEVCSVI